MPPAIAAQSAIGSAASVILAARQSATPMQMAQYQQQSQLAQLQQSQYGNSLQNMLSGQMNAAAPVDTSGYNRRQAERAIEGGDKLIDRISFWSAFPVIGAWVMSRLADKLNAKSADAERWIAAGI